MTLKTLYDSHRWAAVTVDGERYSASAKPWRYKCLACGIEARARIEVFRRGALYGYYQDDNIYSADGALLGPMELEDWWDIRILNANWFGHSPLEKISKVCKGG